MLKRGITRTHTPTTSEKVRSRVQQSAAAPVSSPDRQSTVALRFSPARRRLAGLVMLLALVAGQGCYTYHTTQLSDVQPGEEIRVEIEERGFRVAAPGATREATPRLEGRFGGMTTDSLTLQVWIGEAYQGTPFYSTHQNLMLPLEQVLRVENRQLSRTRTALVTAGVGVLIAVLIDSVGWIDVFGIGDDGGPPQPPDPEGFAGGGWIR